MQLPNDLRRPCRAAAALLTLTMLGACKAPAPAPAPDPNAKPEAKVSVGAVRMPSVFDLARVRQAERGEKTKIYIVFKSIGDAKDNLLLMRSEESALLGLTNTQLQRRLMDAVGRSKRYEVYDDSSSVTPEASDAVIDAQVVWANQMLKALPERGRRSLSRVQINVNMRDRYSGAPLWDTPFHAIGETGGVTGDSITLEPGESENDPRVRRRLGADLEAALQRAFDEIVVKLEAEFRPMGKVVAIDGEAFTIVGGTRNGLQPDDEVVVFRATTTRVGQKDEVVPQAVSAALRCGAVGTATSRCDVVRRDPRHTPQVGDYIILADHSARGTRIHR